MDEKRIEVWEQYQEGAITFIELCRYFNNSVTDEEIEDHNRYCGEEFKVHRITEEYQAFI